MAEGISVIHATSCPARSRSGACRCQPSYRAFVYVTGEQRRRTATFRSLADARRWRHEVLREIARGRLPTARTITVREAAATLLADMESGVARTRSGDRYKPSAIRSYQGVVDRYLLSELGGARLDQVHRRDVQRLADDLLRRGLDASTVRNALMPLRVIFRRALRRGDVSVNPCEHLDLPAVRSTRERIADPAEAAALIAALTPRDQPLWATAFYAGLRRGELRALEASDVDLGNRVIRVQRQLDERNAFTTPKSAAGSRDVPIAAVLAEALEERLSRPGRFLLGVQNGQRPFSASRAQGRADAAWRRAGLQPIRLHEARHTFASMLIAAGIDPKQISTYVGHASIETTFDVYGKLFPTSRREAAARLDAFIDAATAP